MLALGGEGVARRNPLPFEDDSSAEDRIELLLRRAQDRFYASAQTARAGAVRGAPSQRAGHESDRGSFHNCGTTANESTDHRLVQLEASLKTA